MSTNKRPRPRLGAHTMIESDMTGPAYFLNPRLSNISERHVSWCESTRCHANVTVSVPCASFFRIHDRYGRRRPLRPSAQSSRLRGINHVDETIFTPGDRSQAGMPRAAPGSSSVSSSVRASAGGEYRPAWKARIFAGLCEWRSWRVSQLAADDGPQSPKELSARNGGSAPALVYPAAKVAQIGELRADCRCELFRRRS
jgi:hypothetical protein